MREIHAHVGECVPGDKLTSHKYNTPNAHTHTHTQNQQFALPSIHIHTHTHTPLLGGLVWAMRAHRARVCTSNWICEMIRFSGVLAELNEIMKFNCRSGRGRRCNINSISRTCGGKKCVCPHCICGVLRAAPRTRKPIALAVFHLARPFSSCRCRRRGSPSILRINN